LAAEGEQREVVGLRHSKVKGNAAFADGHAQLFPWYWTTNSSYFDTV
jgi:prepilin-type processing-associated H-X9-DG protein